MRDVARTGGTRVVGRFAPSPTGRMHAGNIFAALMAWLVAKSQGGDMVLRIEDLDRERSKPRFRDAVQRDFESLGLTWDAGPFYQHDRDEAYRAAFDALSARGLTYPCFCTRADLHAASAPHQGEKHVYPGTCRSLTDAERAVRRERLEAEARATGAPARRPSCRLRVDERVIEVDDQIQGPYAQRLDRECGDFLVRRSDGAFAYQLAVVVDDAAQGVSSVVRGVDLLCSTPQQVYLQDLLGLPHARYAHVPLFVAPDGRRLAKRNRDAALDELLARFKTPAGVVGHVAYAAGLIPADEPVMPEQLLEGFDLDALARRWRGQIAIAYPPGGGEGAEGAGAAR
ncbi:MULTISPECIES: tRNA glutamyl-Q(34) synthetase GluQRS [unclassified Adlercreutzia]|uniref:tRNA glutamyl-Q(34) synthetase GluQRS n=1 Tax=unclassified Adlercreutzia TaxID=2636013 RepID=UPI001F1517E5|nr:MULTISPECIES: tRNA glutamyl-Q(34) synthetase GluQRS [unclassified Adlercreutzia]